MLETELKELALKEGAIRAGIARKEAFSEAPPSADMRYLKPWANAVVSMETCGALSDAAGIPVFPKTGNGVPGQPDAPSCPIPMRAFLKFSRACAMTRPMPQPHAISPSEKEGCWTDPGKTLKPPATTVIRYAAVRWKPARNG